MSSVAYELYENDFDEETELSSSNILNFPSYYAGFKTNTFPLPTNISEGLSAYVNSLVYSILYREKILQHLSRNNSFDSIVFSDLEIDKIQNNLSLSKVANMIEDLSNTVDFD